MAAAIAAIRHKQEVKLQVEDHAKLNWQPELPKVRLADLVRSQNHRTTGPERTAHVRSSNGVISRTLMAFAGVGEVYWRRK